MSLGIGRLGRELLGAVTPPVIARAVRAVRGRYFSPPSLPQRPLAELFPGIEKTRIALPGLSLEVGPGMLPLRELAVLAAICRYCAPRVIFEIGTFRGASTLVMGLNSEAGTRIYTLDLPPGEPTRFPLDIGSIAGTPYRIGERYLGTEVEPRIQQLHGDSAVFDFSPFAGTVDLFFVDGNHAYENARSDSFQAFRSLRPGGVIVWDDYHPQYGPGVMRALHEMQNRQIYGIAGTRLAVLADAEVSRE